jgi:RNA recognition motif-containing protein
MSIDPFSGRNPSYCFVDLASKDDAEAVIRKLQAQTIRGRPIRIKYDTGKRDCSEAFQLKTRMQNGEWKTFNFTPSTAKPSIFDRYEWKEAREHWTKPIEEGRRLFVGGLSDISCQAFVNVEMQQLFEVFDLQAVSKRVLPVHRDLQIPATGQCYCFVDLETADEAGAAMAALNGMPTPYGGI